MNILLEDESLTVVCKPADLLSEQTPGGSGLADFLAARNRNGYVGVIHRLDRGVGGVMVYARTPSAAASLSESVRNHNLQKQYLAIVHGTPEEPCGRLHDLLFHDRTKNKTFRVDRSRRGVKEALLDYEVLSVRTHPEYGILSLVRITLLTGRTHQIRVQFSSRGYPLLGDGKYGARDRCAIGLFSHSLTFPHPVTEQSVTVCSEPTGEIWDFFDNRSR